MKNVLKIAALVGSLSFTQMALANIDISFDAQAVDGTSVNLAAGTYTGTWTGGGWSAWSSGDYWLNSLLVTADGKTIGFGTGNYPFYSSPAAALDAVKGLTFTFDVLAQQNVKFTVADYLFSDNRGGLSVSIAAVPEPETYAMLLAGLGLMGAVARRRKAKQAQ